MAYVLFKPPDRQVGHVRQGQSRAERAIARITGPSAVGKTLYRIDGTWALSSTPSNDRALEADTDIDGLLLFLQGGHWYFMREEIYDEIVDAGLGDGTVVRPDPEGTYPSFLTWPAENLYPGVA